MQIADMRKEYVWGGLSEADVDADPLRQFEKWFQASAGGQPAGAERHDVGDGDAGRPTVGAVVLLKAFDTSGFTFFTNYDSRKGRELAANAHAALLFFWPEFQRQVRIEGTVERVTEAESDAYFRSRPLGSRLAPGPRNKAKSLRRRDVLEERVRELMQRFSDGEVPRPPHWGGFRVRPLAIEFWQGRPDRLHDRLRYQRVQPAGWRLERLSP